LSYTAKKVCECGNIDEFSDWDHSGGSFITIYCQLLKENDYSIENALNILLKDEILCDDKFDCNLCKPKTSLHEAFYFTQFAGLCIDNNFCNILYFYLLGRET
jgi:hypothetical protein